MDSQDGLRAEPQAVGIRRRALIRRAAIAGAAAWTAPVIIGSIAAPAGALTTTPGCYRLLFTASSSTCSGGPTTGTSGCSVTGTPCSSPEATIPADIVGCLSVTSPAGCSTSTTSAADAVTFTLGSDCSTCTIVAASGRRTSVIGAQCDVSETIGGGGTSVTFDGTGTLPGLAEWDRFEIWISCT